MAAKSEDGYIRWRCKNCGQKLKVKESYEGGNRIRCPKCGQPTTVPLANLDAIAAGTDMEETGDPGQLQLDPDRLIKQLRGEDEESEGPGSAGSKPSLRDKKWSPGKAFGRIEEVDDLVTAVNKINQETAGEVQRLYRDSDLKPGKRAQEMENAGKYRRDRLREILEIRLETIQDKLRPLDEGHERLTQTQLNERDRLRQAYEAVRFFGRYILGIDV